VGLLGLVVLTGCRVVDEHEVIVGSAAHSFAVSARSCSATDCVVLGLGSKRSRRSRHRTRPKPVSSRPRRHATAKCSALAVASATAAARAMCCKYTRVQRRAGLRLGERPAVPQGPCGWTRFSIPAFSASRLQSRRFRHCTEALGSSPRSQEKRHSTASIGIWCSGAVDGALVRARDTGVQRRTRRRSE